MFQVSFNSETFISPYLRTCYIYHFTSQPFLNLRAKFTGASKRVFIKCQILISLNRKLMFVLLFTTNMTNNRFVIKKSWSPFYSSTYHTLQLHFQLSLVPRSFQVNGDRGRCVFLADGRCLQHFHRTLQLKQFHRELFLLFKGWKQIGARIKSKGHFQNIFSVQI